MPASANDNIVNGKANSVEENSLLDTDNEISPLYIPCDYYSDGSHRYIKTGQQVCFFLFKKSARSFKIGFLSIQPFIWERSFK